MTMIVNIKSPFTVNYGGGSGGATITVFDNSITIDGTEVSNAGSGLSLSGGGNHPDVDRLITAWRDSGGATVDQLDFTDVNISRTVGLRKITPLEHAQLMQLIRNSADDIFAFQPDHESYDDAQNALFAKYPESEFNAEEMRDAVCQTIFEEVSGYFASAWLGLQFFRQEAPTVSLRAGRSPRNYGHILTELRRFGHLIDAG